MTFALQSALIATISLAVASASAAQESWVGKWIIMKKNGVEIRTTPKGVGESYAKLTFLSYVVRGEMNGELQVNDGRGNIGWFDKEDAVVLDDAVAYFRKLIQQDPMNIGAYFRRAHAHQRKGDLDFALDDAEEVVRLDPKAYTYNLRGSVRRDRKEFDLAIADFDQAIQLDPKDKLAYSNRAAAWNAKKDYDKAIADYNEVIRLDPKDGAAHNNLAWLWATCSDAKYRDGKKAVESAKHSLAVEPKSANHMDTLAAAYAEFGDFAEAVRWQEKALEDPQFKNNADYRRRLELYRNKKPYRQE